MARNLITTKELVGTKVLGGKDGTQRIGKVHCCVFHPTEKRVIGFLIKRPDLLLMFHRADSFVTLDGFTCGTGTGSCGPNTLPEYEVDATKELDFNFVIVPIKK